MAHPTQPRPGAAPAEEVLDELGDEAIVAQQAVHAPRPAVELQVESRTIVVADDPVEVDPSEVMETRQLPQYSAAHEDTAAAARRRSAARAPTMVLRRAELKPPAKKRNWVVIGIWIAAGVVAFGFGGVLAVITAKGSAAPDPAPEVAEVAPKPAPPPSAAPPTPPATAEPAPETESVEALNASELPVESEKPKPRAKPRAVAAPKSTEAPAKVAPAKTEIPEGI